MSAPEFDLDYLVSRLEPIVADILEQGGTFTGLLETEFSRQASSGLVGMALNAVQSFGKAVWKTIGSSRARKRFQNRLAAASSLSDRQQAIRLFLVEDPARAHSLYDLLVRLDFLRAVAEYAEQLPNIKLLDVTRRLSEVYVPLNRVNSGC